MSFKAFVTVNYEQDGKHTKLQELMLRDEEEKARKLVTQTKQGRAATATSGATSKPPPRTSLQALPATPGVSAKQSAGRSGPSLGAKPRSGRAVEGKAGSCKEEGRGLQAPPGSLWKLPGRLVMKVVSILNAHWQHFCPHPSMYETLRVPLQGRLWLPRFAGAKALRL